MLRIKIRSKETSRGEERTIPSVTRQTPEPVRVFHVFAEPSHGAWIVAPLVRDQLERGYQVEIACANGEYLGHLEKLGAPVRVLHIARRLASFSHFVVALHLLRLMRSRRYHVVHTHTPTASFLARFAASLAGTPVVIAHMRTSWWDSPHPAIRAAFTALEWIAARWTTHTFTINCADARDLVERGIMRRDMVTCLHCGSAGVDLERFNPTCVSIRQTEALRESLGIHKVDFVIGFIGRLVHEKGILDLVEAFRQAAERHENIRLLIVGGVLASERRRDAVERIARIVQSGCLSGRIIQTGFRDDIPQLISTMNVVVLPSYREGFGMVLAEAAAMGRPVISTATRGGRESVIHGKTGLLVPTGDVPALRDALLSLAGDPALCCRMGAAARQLAEQRFDRFIVCERINTIYHQLLARKGIANPQNRVPDGYPEFVSNQAQAR